MATISNVFLESLIENLTDNTLRLENELDRVKKENAKLKEEIIDLKAKSYIRNEYESNFHEAAYIKSRDFDWMRKQNEKLKSENAKLKEKINLSESAVSEIEKLRNELDRMRRWAKTLEELSDKQLAECVKLHEAITNGNEG